MIRIGEQQPVVAVVGDSEEGRGVAPAQRCSPTAELHLIGPMLARSRFDHAVSTDIPRRESQPLADRGRDRLVGPNMLGHSNSLRREIRLREHLEGIALLLLVGQSFDALFKLGKTLDAGEQLRLSESSGLQMLRCCHFVVHRKPHLSESSTDDRQSMRPAGSVQIHLCEANQR